MKMIPYNVHYEIGASLLMILLLCCIVGKKRLRTRSNNLFLCNVCLLIAGNLIDGLCGLINSGMITCSVHTQRLCNALDGSIFLSVDRSIRTVFLEFGVSDELS